MADGREVPTVAFSLCVVRDPATARFCLVHEKADRGWWLPGGGVDAGQTLEEAALRETEEEGGLDVNLTGVLRVEYGQVGARAGRIRTIYAAEPKAAGMVPKTRADRHSKGARWVTLEEMEQVADGSLLGAEPRGRRRSSQRRETCPPLPAGPLGCEVVQETLYLRGPEPQQWFRYVAAGGTAAPMDAVVCERIGAPQEWAGDGDPPRAYYPTVWEVRLAVSRGGEWLLSEGGAALPSVVAQGDPPREAASMARKLGAEPPHGILLVKHTLDVRAADPGAHRVHVAVVYAARGSEQGAAPGGLQWVATAAVPPPLRQVLERPPQPLALVDGECEDVAMPQR
eukprot:TRINITY_DN11406_c0_g1_i1.p1 TRINITY_DN11406_c0_g1~~TRINITY_DN11406_c0_g1_i1.p1  ORF type:complete len:378 (+),score=90.76 TRINITY_DN11406_c0_g1_i1:114-1136(+)